MRPVTVFDRTGVGAPTSSDCAKEEARTYNKNNKEETDFTYHVTPHYRLPAKHIRSAFWLSVLHQQNAAFAANTDWTAKLDKDVRFYQPTEFGVVLAGTEKSLYAIDGSTGETLWRRKTHHSRRRTSRPSLARSYCC